MSGYSIRLVTLLFCTLTLATAVCAQQVELPNASFEKAGDGGSAAGWNYYNWGAEESSGVAGRVDTVAKSGSASVRAESRDGSAKPGVYTHVALEAGRYRIRFFARAEEGREALVRTYLAKRYSPPLPVSDEWTEVVFSNTISNDLEAAEINVQNFGGEPGVVWFDDVSIERLPSVAAQVVPDERDADQQPQMLYFSGNLQFVADTASQWVERGFSGFFQSYLFHDWITDIWAQDGKPETRGASDLLLSEAREALATSASCGLDANVLKVAFYTDLPDPFDGEAYAKLTENFRQGALFGREAGFKLLAIDTEYVAEQYNYSWKGYDYERYTRGELAGKLRERWAVVGEQMAKVAPNMEWGILPEGQVYYGPLWISLVQGLLEGFARAGCATDTHVFCEGTYQLTNPEAIKEHAEGARALLRARLRGQAREYWDAHGKLALGAWPMGYYRAISDATGKFIGWSGRKETFGDKLVGSYADKSAWYPVEEFRTQLAAIRTYSDKYCWIYGHGSSWWTITEEQADEYEKKLQDFPRANYLVPTTENVDEYYRAAGEKNTVTFDNEEG